MGSEWNSGFDAWNEGFIVLVGAGVDTGVYGVIIPSLSVFGCSGSFWGMGKLGEASICSFAHCLDVMYT